MEPEETVQKMQEILEQYGDDVEVRHSKADDLLCEILESLGYQDAVDLFRQMPKWYA